METHHKNEKVIPNLIAAVISCLHSIFNEGYFADKVIERVLKSNRKWGAKDRRFIAEATYGIVRYWRFYHEINKTFPETASADLKHIVAIHLLLSGQYRPEALSQWLPSYDPVERKAGLAHCRAILQSVPDWLDAFGEQELGAGWEAELKALNAQADVFLRVNRLKATTEELRQKLGLEGIETATVPGQPDALRLLKRQNVFISRAFHEGLFEVQDIGSQMVAPFLDPLPGERVIDACAGGGGKTLHLAAIMRNKGRIIALDTDERKLAQLAKRAKRNGISIIECRLIESSKTIKRLEGSADRLLLDVPCSGSGVLRRNPDAKWKLSREKIENLISVQQQILSSYTSMLRPEGSLVYATCSLYPSENERQIEKFLAGNGDFTLEAKQTITPATRGTDGFFFALLKRR